MHARRVRRRSSLRWALAAVGALALTLFAVILAVLARSPVEPHWVIMLIPVTGLVSLVTGLVAWDRRPSNRLGALLVATGISWLAAGLANTALPVPTAIGQVIATMPLALTIHALLAFPEGRVSDGPGRVVVTAAYVVAVVLQAPLYLFAPIDAPFDVLVIAPNAAFVEAAEVVQRAAGTVVALAATWVLVRRAAAVSPAQRKVLLPVSVYGILAVLFAILSGNVLEPLLGLEPISRLTIQLAILAGVPVAFVSALLIGPFGRAGEVVELAVRLNDEDRHGWADALAQALGDPSVRLLFWLPDRGGYADIDGVPAAAPQLETGRALAPISVAGRPVGALDYDPLLNPDPSLISEAGELIALALDRELLTVELRESRRSLRASRARLVEASDRERRRIAEDLHDGVQASLIGLALQAGRLSRSLSSAGAGGARTDHRGQDGQQSPARAASDLEAAITACGGTLRDLVHGIMPSLLMERGLFAATEDLVDSLPFATTVELHGDDRDLPAPVESAAYFVIAEALTNAAKHASATSVSVRLERLADSLSLRVHDNGVGGASLDGFGMHSIADRVEVLGGTLGVESPPGGGTRLVVELSCAS